MDKSIKKKIWDEIEHSTIPEEIKVLYLLANTTDIMCNQTFERIKSVYAKYGYVTNENELLTGINDYCKDIKMAQFHFQQRIHPQIQGATWDVYRDEDSDRAMEAYNGFNVAGNEFCRLILRYYDKASTNREAFKAVFKTLSRFPSGGFIKDEDVAKYKMK